MALLDAPIILFCSERSGSNLIGKIFDAHPEVCAPGASHLFRVMAECSNRYAPGSDTLREAALDLFEAKVSSWQIDEALTREARAALLVGLKDGCAMAAALYAAEARQSGKPIVFTKENSSFAYLHALLSQSRAARVLFMVRDPRDMAVSWVNGPVLRGGVLRASARWQYDQSGYHSAFTQMPCSMPKSFLRYEDLLENTEAELRRVCSDLQLEFAPSMLRFSEVSNSAQKDAARSAMWSNLNKGLLKGNHQKFLAELSDNEIAYIEAYLEPLMRIMGYDRSRTGMPKFGEFDSLDDLRDQLTLTEPHEKPAYLALPAQERQRFERWSQHYKQMTNLPPLSPVTFLTEHE